MMTGRSHPPVALGRLKKLSFSILFTILFFSVIEIALRGLKFQYEPRKKLLWKPTVSGFVGTYEFYIPTHFEPPGYIWVSAPNTPLTDRYGFRRPEIPYAKPPGKIRVAFLGGSTTQGGYRPYPERAIRLLNNAMGTNIYEMLNVACSSYSTHQSLIALKRWVLPRDPDIVVIYHGWNDIMVQSDGFSDHVKDVLLTVNKGPLGRLLSNVRRLRIAQLVGKVVDAADRSWPEQRVPFDRFVSNLKKMVKMCAEKGAHVVIVIRPECQRRPLPPLDEVGQAHYSRMYGTTNREVI